MSSVQISNVTIEIKMEVNVSTGNFGGATLCG